MLARYAIALLAVLVAAWPAAASDYGTRAWLAYGQALRDGPGKAYGIVGELADRTLVRVERCAPLWCLVRAGRERGWVARHSVHFGRDANPPRPVLYPYGATACLYPMPDFAGEGVCFKSGTIIRDLKLLGLDNRFSSVRVNGGSVTLCRDRDFTSYCERVIDDHPALYGLLRGNVSSLKVW